jgi:recombination protein RecR
MIKYPQALEDLIKSFQSLPSVGRKTAERYALYILNHMEEENINDFSNSLLSLKKDIHSCIICGNMTEASICPICMDKERNTKQIIIVEDVKDLYTLENLSIFKGVYHVLNGAISFSKGITVDDLNIDSLIKRLKENEIEEVIIATNATIEGETTARYIKEIIREFDVKITRIAHGLPVGGDLSYADEMTVLKALEGRREY